MTYLRDILINSWLVLGEMSPYLLLGFAVAGILSVLVTKAWVERHLGGGGFGPVVKATLFGIPLPLCSCGVIPVGASLRQHGASRGATSAFLLATPQTGVDSILATYGLLGPVLAVVRPVVALVTGIFGGGMIDALTKGREDQAVNSTSGTGVPPVVQPEAEMGCDSARRADNGRDARPTMELDGCGTGTDELPRGWVAKVKAAMAYALVTLPRDIAGPLLIGVLIAGVLTAVIEPDALAPYIGGPIGLLVMLVIGIPMYVCATGSIPIALAFIHVGASPGAALVFLIAGPATNAATIAVTWKMLGRRTGVLYLASAAVAALAAGFGLDVLAGYVDLGIPLMADHAHGVAGPGWMIHVWAALLLGLLAWAYLSGRFGGGHDPKKHSAERPGGTDSGDSRDEVGTMRFTIEGLRCSHCVAASERALRESPGVTEASVDLNSGQAVVRGRGLDPVAMKRSVDALGYRLVIGDDSPLAVTPA